ncbi:hypothetical protein JCM6882_003673 [Rhodosporidiobolus microsporus]
MGIDTGRFVQPVPENLTCIGAEAHVLCNACYTKVAATPAPSCPSCRRAVKKARSAKTLSRIIDGLDIKCLHVKSGCTWTGPFSNRFDHQKTHEDFCFRIVKTYENIKAAKDESDKQLKLSAKEVASLKKVISKLKGAVTRANNAAAKAKAAHPPAAEQPPSPPPQPEEPAEPLGKRVSKPSARALAASVVENVPVAAGGGRGRSRSRGAEEADLAQVAAAAKRVKVE